MKRKILSSDYYTISHINDVTKIHINSLPILYKYQKVSEYSLSNLDKEEIWGTCPNTFNDPYDCICCYSKSEIVGAIKTLLHDERFNRYKMLFETNKRAEIVNHLTSSLLSNDSFRNQYCVSCFSIYNDSEIMWGHYADCAKGFVVAYDGDELMNCSLASNKSTIEILKSINMLGIDLSKLQEDTHSTIMPIIYCNRKATMTTNLIQILPFLLEYYDDLCNEVTISNALEKYIKKIQESFYTELPSNNDMFYSIMCKKNKCWSYEQEWRIWAYNANIFTGNFSSPYVKIGNVSAKAIYLGEHISRYNKLVLMHIAKDKNIPIYQMKTIMYKNYCRLSPILLDN